MRCAFFMVLVLTGTASGQAGNANPNSSEWQRLVAIIQYLQTDYPAAIQSQNPQELEEQKGFAASAVEVVQSLGGSAVDFIPQLRSIQRRIEKGADPEGVRRDCAQLIDGLVFAGGLSRSPRHPPDLALGVRLYATDCAACHGEDGRAEVPIAPSMNPKPLSFHDPDRMTQLTPFKAFNALTFGVTGTAMPSYSLREEDERWAMSFYIFTLRHPRCSDKPPRVTLEELSTSSDSDLSARYGSAAVPCLRQKIRNIDVNLSLLNAKASIETSLRELGNRNRIAARQAALDAYLNGIEPVESILRARNATVVTLLEKSFLRFRADLENDRPTAPAKGQELLGLIDQALRTHDQSPAASEIQAFLVIVREGFEVTVIIAALLAVLKKMRQEQFARVVHAGWISALACGVAVFVVARQVLAGARREWVEGTVALFAVGMLLYAALWLNARANIRKFMGKLRSQMETALGTGSVIGLFTISFAAMFRESFETALFLQGLSIDSQSGVVWGALAGCATLIALVLFVSRVGYRLPMKTLFNVSTVLLFGTAVVLLGKGLHSLQQVGVLRLYPLPLPGVESLGIYADAFSLIPQAILLLTPLIWTHYRTVNTSIVTRAR